MRKNLILTILLLMILSQVNLGLSKEKELKIIDNNKFMEIVTKQSQKDGVVLYDSNIGRFATLQNKKGELEGYFLLTSDFATPKGYQGPTALSVEVDIDGKIVSTEIIESLDTKTYVKKIERKKFIQQFLGLSHDKIKVQAVTGATMTSDAITQSITETLQAFAPLKTAIKIVDGVATSNDTTYTVEKLK